MPEPLRVGKGLCSTQDRDFSGVCPCAWVDFRFEPSCYKTSGMAPAKIVLFIVQKTFLFWFSPKILEKISEKLGNSRILRWHLGEDLLWSSSQMLRVKALSCGVDNSSAPCTRCGISKTPPDTAI